MVSSQFGPEIFRSFKRLYVSRYGYLVNNKTNISNDVY